MRMGMAQHLLGVVLAAGWTVSAGASETRTYAYDALGRLVTRTSAGSVNNNQTSAYCYDSAGNRVRYKANQSGVPANCQDNPGGPGDPGGPNAPPIANDDSINIRCGESGTINVIANDTDPDGNYPLSVVTFSIVSGSVSSITLISSTSFDINAGWMPNTAIVSYTVKDSLGATGTGQLTIRVTGSDRVCYP